MSKVQAGKNNKYRHIFQLLKVKGPAPMRFRNKDKGQGLTLIIHTTINRRNSVYFKQVYIALLLETVSV